MKHQGFHLITRAGRQWLECRALSRFPSVRHAFSTRVLDRTSGQSANLARTSAGLAAGLNLGFVEGDQRVRVEENRPLFLNHLGMETLALATLRQKHSSLVYCVSSEGAGRLKYTPSGCAAAQAASGSLPSGDALLTAQPGILLSVRTADCVPILLLDPTRRVVAAVHAGWRGSLQRIAEKTVGEMRRAFHSQPEELLAAMGPSIRACCYEVGEEVVEAFRGRFARCEGYFKEPPTDEASRTLALRHPPSFLSMRHPGRGPDRVAAAHLDLVAVTRDQLQRAGLRSTNIYVADFCTACRTDLFFSHRKEGNTGRMMAVIGMV